MKKREKSFLDVAVPCPKCGCLLWKKEDDCSQCALTLRWDARKKLSLRKAKNRVFAIDLLERIRASPQNTHSHSWMTELEYHVWGESQRLRTLARRAGGWWCWHDGEVFVPMDQWLVLFYAHRKKEETQAKHLAAEEAYCRLLAKHSSQARNEVKYRWGVKR